MKKLVLIAVVLAAVLAIGSYFFLSGGRAGPKLSADTPSPSAAEPVAASGSGHAKPLPEAQESSIGPTSAEEERPPERESEKKGDLTLFSLAHGDIGYVDVGSILRDRNPYSIVDLLQAHSELTGAGDSLEIRIDRISENEIWGQEVLFRQMIDGRPTNENGKVFFSPSGAVTMLYGDIIDTRSLNPGDILVLAPEAEAIAREVGARYAETLEPERPEWGRIPIKITLRAAEMRYELDAGHRLVRLWHVPVDIYGPAATGIRVSVSPETGEVIAVKSAVVHSRGRTKFILCDAAGIRLPAHQCDLNSRTGSPQNVLVGGECKLTPAASCQQSKYAVPLETVKSVIKDVQATSGRSIASTIHIVVNYPFGGTTDGAWREETGAIQLDADLRGADLKYTAAHEAFHAVSQTPEGGVEHGLVYAMTALWTGNRSDWQYQGKPVTDNYSGYRLVQP